MFAGQISDLSAHGMHSAYSRTPAGATGLEHGIRYANVLTVTSQSVLCSDSPVFQWYFLFTRFTYKRGSYDV